MSSSSSEKEILHSEENSWFSITPIFDQSPSNLMESTYIPHISSQINPRTPLSDFELQQKLLRNSIEALPRKEEAVNNRTWFPKLQKTRTSLKDELEILKVNMSINDALVLLKDSQIMRRRTTEVNYKRRKKLEAKSHVSCFKACGMAKTKDLLNEIEMSEIAKTDKTPWKFLRRGSALRKEFINSTKLAFEIQVLQSGFNYQLDSRFQNIQPVKITCPNCLFYVTTAIKNVKTIRFKFISAVLATIGCIFPDVFYTFRDTVHLCPLCKIYLGFCPTYRVRTKKSISALQLSISKYIKKKENSTRERKIKKSPGEKNLITAAKNFAIQEAAIENSETNLKKLKLLTTHINNQLDSLHNSSSKMEVVLEQVRSMQR